MHDVRFAAALEQTSPSRWTASAPARVRATTRTSVTPGIGCTNGCSPPAHGSRVVAVASTTPSSNSSVRGSAPRSWVPGSSATPDGTRTRSGRRVGSQPAVPHAGLRPHPSPAPFHRNGGRHDVSLIDVSPAEAREAADGQDVRIGGGPTVIRDFLAAGLIDHLHIVVVPILLGRGVRLWDGLEGNETDYRVEATSSPSGVTHLTFTRA